MCQPPGGLGHLGHLPPSCAVLLATNNFTNINTNTRDRACMLTLMSSNFSTDLFAWIFRLFWNHWQKIFIPGCYLCNRPANEVCPDHLQNNGWLYWTVPFASGRPRRMIEISCMNKLSNWTVPFCSRPPNEDNPDLFT